MCHFVVAMGRGCPRREYITATFFFTELVQLG
jgi:hypothetical protein